MVCPLLYYVAVYKAWKMVIDTHDPPLNKTPLKVKQMCQFRAYHFVSNTNIVITFIKVQANLFDASMHRVDMSP